MARSKASETETMKQYLGIKRDYPEGILFFRLGDFYEMFFDDAVRASELLDIALTSRNKNSDDPVPMAGVPHHSARGYIARLTELGEKVVLCEQVEDPKLVRGKRPVKREVVRVVTPGVVLDDEILDPKSPRFLAAVAIENPAPGAAHAASPDDADPGQNGRTAGALFAKQRFGLGYLDVTTGEFHATELAGLSELCAELARVRPRELLLAADSPLATELRGQLSRDIAFSAIEPMDPASAEETLQLTLAGNLRELGLADKPLAARAAADVVAYARATQPAGTLPLGRLHVYRPGETLVLDQAAIANLELTETLMERSKAGSLLAAIDATSTAAGGRLLRRWLLYPLTDIAPIRRRQDAVEYFVEQAMLRRDVRAELRSVHDLERLGARVLLGVATPRDLGRLRDSLARVPEVVRLVEGQDAAGVAPVAGVLVPELLMTDRALLSELQLLHELLDDALVDEPTSQAKEGGFIRDGYCEIVDRERRLATGGVDEVRAIEERERERTGIASLKVKYNNVFGYFIEVTKTHLSRVPDDYTRKQTIANGERYMTSELSELEAKIVSAQDALVEREREIFDALCDQVAEKAEQVRAAGEHLAAIDACAGLAEVAHARGYVRPLVDDSEALDIEDGRHPVVERMVEQGGFVPNSCHLDTRDAQVLLITGPNMAGKSTYMRQVAHIVLLAQMGAFVPAARARVGICDQIFTRVGASDNLARGESTFMVEMRETSAILAGATRRSLIVLDEVGRGTSTFDGVSIAWAVTEFIHDAIGARALFATHYHELCLLADTRPRVRNVSVAVREHQGEIVFLRQIVDGGSSRSYGIDVARLAGLPRSVVSRARQILETLEGDVRLGRGTQLSLFSAAQSAPPPPEPDRAGEIVERLRAIDPHRTTPLQALELLAELCQKV